MTQATGTDSTVGIETLVAALVPAICSPREALDELEAADPKGWDAKATARLSTLDGLLIGAATNAKVAFTLPEALLLVGVARWQLDFIRDCDFTVAACEGLVAVADYLRGLGAKLDPTVEGYLFDRPPSAEATA